MGNSAFGDTMGNVRKHGNINLVTTEASRNYNILTKLSNQARSQGGRGGREGVPPAWLKQVQFPLNKKHGFFDAMP